MSRIEKKDYVELYQIMADLKTPEDVKEFLDDLVTKKEEEAFVSRLKAAKLLSEGETYEEVIRNTSISSATLSRVSRALQYGKGYKKIFKIK